ncbi:hypothetical protein pb186bvf_020991 [Paramecium bursaria]
MELIFSFYFNSIKNFLLIYFLTRVLSQQFLFLISIEICNAVYNISTFQQVNLNFSQNCFMSSLTNIIKQKDSLEPYPIKIIIKKKQCL